MGSRASCVSAPRRQPGRAETPEAQLALRGGEEVAGRYRIDGNTVILLEGEFQKDADGRYAMELKDQGIEGEIEEDQEPGTTRMVVGWMKDDKEVVPEAEGTGIVVDLAVASRVKGKRDQSIGDVLKDVVMGLIPTNLFDAMANNKVLPLIVFSLIFGAVLTTIGEKGKPVIDVVGGINEAIMEIIRPDSATKNLP